jgi:hypothetical protein
MKSNSCEVRVLIKGRPATEFFHEGANYMEGRGGSEFEIEVRNLTHKRQMAVVSVDGLSVISGQVAGLESPGYILNPFQTIVIPGWKLDNNSAAKFEFGSRASSYVQSVEGTATNCGVIGVMIWSEKVPVIINNHSTWANSPMRAMSKGLGGGMFGSVSASAASMDSSTETLSASVASVNNLGTGFGAATTFNTSSVTFEKDAVVDTLVMYYDDARGLKARGIVIERPVQRYSTTPNPFPGIGCTPPPGWKG